MTKFTLLTGAALALALNLCATSATAHENDPKASHSTDHAPIGVMADHRHKKGEVMLSYRYMHMNMDGSRDGTTSLSPETIATTVANPFAGQAGQPQTLRVVPTSMTMDMYMAGAMYGVTDRLTVMAMGSYISKSMDHTTFQGGMGTDVLGEFTTESEGFGDTTVGVIYGLDDGTNPRHQLNLNLAISLPTGSNTQTDDVLAPNSTTPNLRLPYPMQIGTGTYDIKPGMTYRDTNGKVGWGGQAMFVIPLAKNKEGYRRGARTELTGWLSYEPHNWVSLSSRVKHSSQGQIVGQDAAIVAPVQTADPANQGGNVTEVLFGVNLLAQSGALKGHRIALEYGLPLHRNLNGPQLETDSMVTLGWQKSF